MRKHELLSDNERKQLLNIPENRDDLVRLYTFERMEIDLIRQRREDYNRLGVALQLALLRHPGMTMSQMLDNGGLPDNLVIFIAEQIDIPVQTLSDYGLRGQTMTDHARELALALGMRPAARSDIPLMIEAAAASAWATDKGMPIASGIVEALRQAKIVLPALSSPP